MRLPAHSPKTWQLIGGLLAFTGVWMGLVATHVMRMPLMSAYTDRGSQYQIFHALVLLWLVGRTGLGHALARWLFLSGILVYSGSYYYKAFTSYPNALMYVPHGAVLLMLGWVALAFAGPTAERPLDWIDGITLIAGVLAFYVAYLMADELLRQASRMARAGQADAARSSLS